MAGEIVYVDALPYFDHGYDEPGVREAVSSLIDGLA
jgi:Breast carcinoma amplified sequence 2 (BCAS2)